MAQPNENITHVQAIEGLACEIQKHLGNITPPTAAKEEIRNGAVQRLSSWQRHSLFNLRQAFEN